MFQLEGGEDGARAVGQIFFFEEERGGFLEIFQRLLDGFALGGRAGLGIVSHQPAFGFAGINDGRERLHADTLNQAMAIGKWGKWLAPPASTPARTSGENF